VVNEKLFGKALQVIVTQALLNLNKSGKETVTISELYNQILLDRPGLNIHLSRSQDRQNFKRRIWNCIKKLGTAEMLKIENISVQATGIRYNIIYTKFN
jgi:hypothetical protein